MARHARWAAAACALLLLLVAGPSWAVDHSILWKIVHGRCVPGEEATGRPAPCAFVDLEGRYAVLKDIVGRTQYLLIPTDRLAGIESPELLAPGAPNYWEDAWQARRFMARSAGRPVPREDVGLAINSRAARSQDQLHIHVDCLDARVREALRANARRIGPTWSRLAAPLAGRHYLAMKVNARDLSGVRPFRLLADNVPGAATDMGNRTLVVAGAVLADGRPGFYLLADRVDPAIHDRASGEALLDHGCAVLKPAPQGSP